MSKRRESSGIVPRRRSWLTLIGWVAAIILLTLLGRGVDRRLAPMSLDVPGTPSSRAEAMLRDKFGNTVPVAILLRGPSAQVDRQGERLVYGLHRLKHVQVLSPWDGSSTVRSLRPSPEAAFVLVNFVRPVGHAMEVVPATEFVLAHTVHAPVHSYVTGVAVIGAALQQATLADTTRAEMIALPVLILVLLLVFRSPIAAAVPLAMGVATVMAGHGLLWLASFITPINSLGVAIAAMMSLALGVDYALLMVSRVRQELLAGRDHDTAVAIAARVAGRTIAAAGGTLALTMLAASAVATPGLLGPVAIGVVISGLLSVALALSAMPALLRLLGPWLNRFQIRLPRLRGERRRGGVGALAERLIAHPLITVPLILAGMLALAAPAGALRLGPPDAAELPASSPARKAVQMVERTVGPGWTAPFVIVASAGEGTMTTTPRLKALMHWQEQIAHESGVAAVLGPASVTGARRKLAESHDALVSAPKRLEGAQQGIHGLRSGLSQASDGVAALRSGLASAAGGASSLGSGAGRAQSGAGLLAGETARAQSGAGLLAGETARAQAGAKLLATETGRAHNGSNELHTGLAQAAAGSAQLATGLDEAAAGAEHLASSDTELTSGAQQLAQGIDKLDDTVHAIVDPVDSLAEQLHSFAGLLSSLEVSDQELSSRSSDAMRELEAMTIARGDPRYQALAEDVKAIRALSERNSPAQLARVRQQLLDGVEALGQLPAQLGQLIASLDRMRAGADRLATGARESEEGAGRLSAALHQLAAGGHVLTNGLNGLTGGAGELSDGLGKLRSGDRKLARGLGKLARGGHRLAGGLGKLAGGDSRLAGGLGKLAAGNERLASGLAGGARRSGELATGLHRAQGPLKS
jgi:putative drug exporter of the RND superfamily